MAVSRAYSNEFNDRHPMVCRPSRPPVLNVSSSVFHGGVAYHCARAGIDGISLLNASSSAAAVIFAMSVFW